MKFTINYSRDHRRSGVVEIGEERLETPCCLLYTRAGTVPHVVQDLLINIENLPGAVQLTLPTLYDQPCKEVIDQEKGIKTFLGLQDFASVITVQDPSQDPPSGYNEENAVSVWDAGGRRKINVEQFTTKLSLLRPDAAECLCDTIPANGQTQKRIRKSVDRTLKFLDEVVKHKDKNKDLHNCALLGPIEGSDSLEERLRSARETAKRPVAGFTLQGFSCSTADWETLLQRTVDELPREKVRVSQGIGAPDDVLQAVECGLDLFDSSFPYQVTERGCALLLRSRNKRLKLDINNHPTSTNDTSVATVTEPKNTGSPHDSGVGIPKMTEYEMDLNQTSFKADMSPVQAGCACYCCANHSRAYLHHLLVTKEMLAKVLLMIHNLHQYFLFFKKLRQAINGNLWDEFKDEILNPRS